MPTADNSWTDVIGILSVLLLVAANGFFVASEFSLVAVRRSRVAQLVAAGRANAKALLKAINNLDANLAGPDRRTYQLGGCPWRVWSVDGICAR
jgi:putative hemolysin